MTTKYEDNKGTWKQNTKKTKAHDNKRQRQQRYVTTKYKDNKGTRQQNTKTIKRGSGQKDEVVKR